MNLSIVTGFLGELIVGHLLQCAGHPVRHFGKQHGIDLEVPSLGAKIDIKTSLLKREVGCEHWGWALLSGSKNKTLRFSHVVCIALDDKFSPGNIFVVARDDLDEFPAGIPPFTKNKRILIALRDGESLPARAPALQREATQRCVILEAEGMVKKVRDAAGLVAALRPTSNERAPAAQQGPAPDGARSLASLDTAPRGCAASRS
jgi:hypothetical protein